MIAQMIVLLVILADIQSGKELTTPPQEPDYYGGGPYDTMENYDLGNETAQHDIVCINCSGILDARCNVPYRLVANPTAFCTGKCEMAVLYRNDTALPKRLQECTIIRGCEHYAWSPAPPGYIIKFIATCEREMCNMEDKNIVDKQATQQAEALEWLNDYILTGAASTRHRTGIPLFCLLLTYHSIF